MSNTCATCKFYTEISYWNSKPVMVCEGPASEHMDVTADDDQGLSAQFKPPSTFGCNGWVKKDA